MASSSSKVECHIEDAKHISTVLDSGLNIVLPNNGPISMDKLKHRTEESSGASQEGRLASADHQFLANLSILIDMRRPERLCS